MLTAVIQAKTLDGMRQQMKTASKHAAAFEWRMDAVGVVNFDELKALREGVDKPLIITLRSISQGGESDLIGTERLLAQIAYASLRPNFIDLECSDDDSLVERIKSSFPKLQIIRSFHDFNTTPVDLKAVLEGMRHKAVDIYKIIGFANTMDDCTRMLDFVKGESQKTDVIGHCMGTKGSFTRILGAAAGNVLTYAEVPVAKLSLVVEGETPSTSPAPGMVPLIELAEIYRLYLLNPDTSVFALLGDPVETSMGHRFHNKEFLYQSANSVYVKIPLGKKEIPSFIKWSKINNFKGFSITMPHKESILSFVDTLTDEAKNIGAVNTLKIEKGVILGTNTDGAGALDPLEKQMPVKGKNILLLGAGGVAKAIAFEGLRRGAKVTVINRTENKAKDLAEALGCDWIKKQELLANSQNKFDILINCLPQSAADFLDRKNIIDTRLTVNALVMDVVYGLGPNEVINHAKSTGLLTVNGDEMFNRQAQLQQEFWYE